MSSTKYITEPACLNTLEHKGNGTDHEIGVVVKLPKPTDVLEIHRLISRNSRSPLQIRQGVVKIFEYIPENTWGDSIVYHENSTLEMDWFTLDNPNYKISNDPVARKKYHVDRIIQAYSLSGCAMVGDVSIKNIFMHTKGIEDQGVMLSEAKDFYHDFELGTESLDIDMVYEWLLRCTNISGLKMGGGKTKLKGMNGNAPAIRIGSKSNPIKETPYESSNIKIAQALQHSRNVIPFEADNRVHKMAQSLGVSFNDLERLLA